MITYARASVGDVINEILPLAQLHFKEIASDQEILLNPNFELYKAVEKVGGLKIFTARKENRLIGYHVLFVSHHMHRATSKQATQDLLFIHPQHRGFGLSFLRYAIDELFKDGIEIINMGVSTKLDYSPLLKRLGFTLKETTYSLRRK